MHSFNRILKVMVCILLGILVIKGLDFALYPCTFVRNDVHTVTTQQRDVIILGTSNGMSGLNPDAMLEGTGKTGHNLCVGGEYPIDAYYLTKLIIEKQNPEMIIFELSPGYFTTEKEKGNNYLLFYHEFPLSLTKAAYYFDTMLDVDFRFPMFAFHEYSLSYEISKLKETIYQKATGNYDRSYFKSSSQEYHDNGFIEKYPVAIEDFPGYSATLFSVDAVQPTNMEYLGRLIQLCKENNIEFVAMTMPLANVMLKSEEESYREAWKYFSSYFKEQNVRYYNYNWEYYDAFTHDLKDYVDYDGHLNGEMANRFSSVFGKMLFNKKKE